ncbi:MAG: tetratricopeptide repeat protein [Geobacteraceae bacterium]|nr:tetratricopeptide repeat protein [Geobacteraceae bacterium]
MKNIIFAPFFASALLLAPLLANAGEVEDLVNGIALVQQGKYDSGIKILHRAVELDPENADANYYLGMALNRTAPDKTAESHLKRSLMVNPLNPGLNYELGIHYFQKDVKAEAADYFEQVIELAPGSEMASKSAEYLRKINEKSQGKRWDLSIFLGGQYDSNVMLNGRGMPLPGGYSGKSDWSALTNLRASYTPLKSEQTEIGIGYSFYQSLHNKLYNFDITQNLVDLSATYAIDSNTTVKGVYSFEYLLLGGNDYDFAHSLAPSLVMKNSMGTTTFDYRFRNTSYRNSEQFLTNSDRNGYNNLAGISHILPISDSVAIWGLYNFDSERTNRREWDYVGNRFLAGLRAPLPFTLVADLSAEIYLKDYRVNDPAYAATRHDNQQTFSATVTKYLSANYSISLSEVLSKNKCTIPEFEYERSITSLLFNAKF